MALASHASMSGISQHQSRETSESGSDGVPTYPAKRNRDLVVCPTDDEAVVPRKKDLNRQSFDYLWRSGVAGGVAGCVVSGLFHVPGTMFLSARGRALLTVTNRPKPASRRLIE